MESLFNRSAQNAEAQKGNEPLAPKPPTLPAIGPIAPQQPQGMKRSIFSGADKDKTSKSYTGPITQSESPAPKQESYGIHTLLNHITPQPEPEGKNISGPDLSADFEELRLVTTTGISQVIDPLRIQLRGGKIIQLTGIDIPDLDPYEPGEISVKAKDFLTGLLTNRQVRLYQTRDRKTGRLNRMGYELGHLAEREDDIWVQGALLASGLARVRPSIRNTEMAAQMIALEDYARGQKKGLWSNPRYKVYNPETASEATGDWAIVTGKVHSVATIRNTTYLNFGPDWRTDFTIALDSRMRRALANQGINATTLTGDTVRIRGWVEDYNGPMIKLNHPVWLELLPKTSSRSINN